jgi:hypothetical protein
VCRRRSRRNQARGSGCPGGCCRRCRANDSNNTGHSTKCHGSRRLGWFFANAIGAFSSQCSLAHTIKPTSADESSANRHGAVASKSEVTARAEAASSTRAFSHAWSGPTHDSPSLGERFTAGQSDFCIAPVVNGPETTVRACWDRSSFVTAAADPCALLAASLATASANGGLPLNVATAASASLSHQGSNGLGSGGGALPWDPRLLASTIFSAALVRRSPDHIAMEHCCCKTPVCQRNCHQQHCQEWGLCRDLTCL